MGMINRLNSNGYDDKIHVIKFYHLSQRGELSEKSSSSTYPEHGDKIIMPELFGDRILANGHILAGYVKRGKVIQTYQPDNGTYEQ